MNNNYDQTEDGSAPIVVGVLANALCSKAEQTESVRAFREQCGASAAVVGPKWVIDSVGGQKARSLGLYKE